MIIDRMLDFGQCALKSPGACANVVDTKAPGEALGTELYLVIKTGEGAPASIDDEESPAAAIADPVRMNRPEEAAENNALRQELQYALSQISEEHRRIVILRDVGGLSYADIARTLGLEEGTVKSRLARARAALRRILTERGNISLASPSKDTEGRREHA